MLKEKTDEVGNTGKNGAIESPDSHSGDAFDLGFLHMAQQDRGMGDTNTPLLKIAQKSKSFIRISLKECVIYLSNKSTMLL